MSHVQKQHVKISCHFYIYQQTYLPYLFRSLSRSWNGLKEPFRSIKSNFWDWKFFGWKRSYGSSSVLVHETNSICFYLEDRQLSLLSHLVPVSGRLFSCNSELIETSTGSVGGKQNRRVCRTEGSRGRVQQCLGEGLSLKQGGAWVCSRAEREGGQCRHRSSDGELTLQETRGQRFGQVLVLP